MLIWKTTYLLFEQFNLILSTEWNMVNKWTEEKYNIKILFDLEIQKGFVKSIQENIQTTKKSIKKTYTNNWLHLHVHNNENDGINYHTVEPKIEETTQNEIDVSVDGLKNTAVRWWFCLYVDDLNIWRHEKNTNTIRTLLLQNTL